jgi:hypothetical protein
MDEGQGQAEGFATVEEFMTWAVAEVILAGGDPMGRLGKTMEEATPFEVVGACLDELEVSARRTIERMRKVIITTREQFSAILTSEGFTEEEAGWIWDGRSDALASLGHELTECNEGDVRLAAREVLPIVRLMRQAQ